MAARPARPETRQNKKSSASGGGGGGAEAGAEASAAFKAGKLPNFAHFVGDAIAASDGGVTEDEVNSICEVVLLTESTYTTSDVMFTCDSVVEASLRGMTLADYTSQHGHGCIPARARNFAESQEG